MFKDKLRELRMQKGISQYELADQLFVSRSAIAKWESGNGIPSDVNLEAICEFFDVEEEWLLDRKDMKEVVNNLDKKNNKVLWFVLGIVMPLLLILLSMLGCFKWNCGEEICIALFIPNRGIFSLLVGNYSWLVLIACLIYVYQFVFSFIYWKKDIKKGKIIQLINLSISIICFIITFIVACKESLNESFVLFFM